MIRSTGRSNFAWASSHLAIWPGPQQCSQNIVPLSFNFIFGHGKSIMGWGPVRREGRGLLSSLWKSKAFAQGVACGQVHCLGAWLRNYWTTWLDICAGCLPSAASEYHNRSFYSQSVLMEQIPYARCLKCSAPPPPKTTIDLTLF
jgi:hypothetical protein